MTKEEAIKKIKKVVEESVIFEDELEAFDMAIRSLVAWKDVQKEIYKQIDALDDIPISRERNAYFKALDIVNKYLKEVENGKSN